MPKITPPCKVWQWDINDTIIVEGIEDISKWQVHFASTGDSNALVLEINPDMTCYIPNQLVELGQAIYAYLYNVEEQRAYTETIISLDTSSCVDTGLILPWGDGDTDIGGYINELGLVDGLAAASFCISLDGSNANPVGDYCYILAKSTTNHVLLAGGYANNGSLAGRFYANWGNVRGSSQWTLSASPSSKTALRSG